MTPEEAIEILQHEHDYAQLLSHVNKALNLAIEALEKQIPKKPSDITSPVVRWGICPVCKGEPFALGRPNRIFDSCNYCSNCGQALDWSDEE